MSDADRALKIGSMEIGRRALLRAGALAGGGLAAAALVGCGDDEDDDGAPSAQQQPSGGGAAPAKEPDYVTQAKADGAPFPYNYEEPSKTPKAGGVFRMAVAWDAGPWDPNKASGGHAQNVSNAVTNRLVGLVSGPKLNKFKIEFEPELAKSWELSPDGLTYTFKLQTGVKYHNVAPVNGRAFRANDVKLNYDRAAAEGINKPFFEFVDRVEIPDDTTVRIRMKKPDIDFLIPIASRQLPIYAPELFEGTQIDSKAIGTGPFILEEATKGVNIKLKANAEYWESKPLLEGIEWRIMPDPAAQLAAFRAGQVDWTGNGVSNFSVLEALIKSNPDVQVTSDPILAATLIYALNATSAKFKDARVRQALNLAVDRERMVQLYTQGRGRIMPAFGWPFVFDKQPTGAELGPWWKYDPAEAKKMISAAGADGMSFELIWSSAYVPTAGDLINSPMGELFKAVGVNMQQKNQDYNGFNATYYGRKFVESGDALLGFTTTAPSATGYFFDNVHSKSSKAYHAITDTDIDTWAEQQRSEVNPQKRRETLRKIWDKTLQQAYRIEIPNTFGNTVFQPWVRYYRFNGPYIGMQAYYEFGVNSHLAWLDK